MGLHGMLQGELYLFFLHPRSVALDESVLHVSILLGLCFKKHYFLGGSNYELRKCFYSSRGKLQVSVSYNGNGQAKRLIALKLRPI
jgi:hypothetical protein